MKFYIALAILLFLMVPAQAEPENAWRGDIKHFQDNDSEHWQSGHWSHEIHNGHMGWWWIVDKVWYQYPSASYPFPDPFVPYGVTVETPPSAGTHYWYYCSGPAGYYPYVSLCFHKWRRVASTAVVAPLQEPTAPSVQEKPHVIKEIEKPEPLHAVEKPKPIVHPVPPKKPVVKSKPAPRPAPSPVAATPVAPPTPLVPTAPTVTTIIPITPPSTGPIPALPPEPLPSAPAENLLPKPTSTP